MQIPSNFLHALVPIYERYGRTLPRLATLVFVVLGARAAADLMWQLIPPPEGAAWTPLPVAAPAGPAARDPNAVDVNLIVGARLFGEYRAPEPTQTALLEAPETRLNLTLVGILAGTRERDSRALIAGGSGGEEPYAVGDDVARGVRLQAIFPDRVILERDGRLETLRLERDKPSEGGGYSPLAEASAPVDTASVDAAPTLGQIRDQVLKDPAKASEYIRVQPANVGGQLKGYRIYPGRDRSVFSGAGLRPGDLVTAVNGVELNDPARALQLLGELSSVSQVTLTVERAGQPQTINVTLN
ncbi:MAG: type II secretion system protein GspC [Gammaproteobacteria bacterium]|nr:type II secretion system protein GspC [Gammaproteobacteria bacterium]